MECWSVGVWECGSVGVGVLECWSVEGLLMEWTDEVLECGSVRVLECENAGVREC